MSRKDRLYNALLSRTNSDEGNISTFLNIVQQAGLLNMGFGSLLDTFLMAFVDNDYFNNMTEDLGEEAAVESLIHYLEAIE